MLKINTGKKIKEKAILGKISFQCPTNLPSEAAKAGANVGYAL